MITSVQNHKPIVFRGINTASVLRNAAGQEQLYIHHTSFMRDFNILDFAARYLKENFPQGTHSTHYGCSYGHEPISFTMLLDDKRYKSTGIDISRGAIKAAKKGEFVVEPTANESILFPKESFVEKGGMIRQETESGEIINVRNQVYQPDYDVAKTPQLLKLFSDWFEVVTNKRQCKKIINSLFPPNIPPLSPNKVLTLRPQKANGIVNFEQGDIMKASELSSGQKSGAVFFSNAIYLLAKFQAEALSREGIGTVRNVAGQIHSILEDKGLFIMGRLPLDHLLKLNEKRIHSVEQNGAKIDVFDSSEVHDTLREVGFSPVFYEKDSSVHRIYLPAVWRKI